MLSDQIGSAPLLNVLPRHVDSNFLKFEQYLGFFQAYATLQDINL